MILEAGTIRLLYNNGNGQREMEFGSNHTVRSLTRKATYTYMLQRMD